MTDINHEPKHLQDGEDDLDRTLDAVLAKYAAVKPREGLEERILANLRIETTNIPGHTWWRWGLAVAATAVFIAVVGLALRSRRPSQPLVKNPPSVTTPAPKTPETQLASHDPETVQPPAHRLIHRPLQGAITHSAQAEAVTESYPKLDQFPSPQPLSDQEKILESYIAQDPEHATLIAEARMEMLRKDQEERQREATNDGGDARPRDTKSR
jgi:hypothetical protein